MHIIDYCCFKQRQLLVQTLQDWVVNEAIIATIKATTVLTTSVGVVAASIVAIGMIVIGAEQAVTAAIYFIATRVTVIIAHYWGKQTWSKTVSYGQ